LRFCESSLTDWVRLSLSFSSSAMDTRTMLIVPWRSIHPHKPTTLQFNPHYPSTQRTVCCDNLLLWHSYTCTICSGISCLPQLWGGRFFTCDMTSTLLKMLCDIMSTLSWSEIWMVCHMIFGPICDVLPAVQQNVDILSQDFFDTFVMSSRLFSKMWTFCCMIPGHICDVLAAVQGNVSVLSQDFKNHLWWFWRFLDTSVLGANQLLNETWTFCRTFFICHVCDD
jgi:hypothetical protein